MLLASGVFNQHRTGPYLVGGLRLWPPKRAGSERALRDIVQHASVQQDMVRQFTSSVYESFSAILGARLQPVDEYLAAELKNLDLRRQEVQSRHMEKIANLTARLRRRHYDSLSVAATFVSRVASSTPAPTSPEHLTSGIPSSIPPFS